jgi:hypothetical protein
MYIISVAAFPATIDKTGSLEFRYKLFHIRWHETVLVSGRGRRPSIGYLECTVQGYESNPGKCPGTGLLLNLYQVPVFEAGSPIAH